MSTQKKFAAGGYMPAPQIVSVDCEYLVPTNLGPIMTAEQMRELGREALEEIQQRIHEESKPKGRRADTRVSYMDTWAKRYWRSQGGVERDRLRKGKARHRAHRDALPVQSPNGDDS